MTDFVEQAIGYINSSVWNFIWRNKDWEVVAEIDLPERVVDGRTEQPFLRMVVSYVGIARVLLYQDRNEPQKSCTAFAEDIIETKIIEKVVRKLVKEVTAQVNADARYRREQARSISSIDLKSVKD